MNAVEFLESLVAAYSPSGEERPAAEVALSCMKEFGFKEPHIDDAGSIVGRWGKDGSPRILLLGHIDTVPGEIEIRREENEQGEVIMYGRGSVDAKGPFATFVQAVGSLPVDIPLHITVVGAVEEEVPSSKGARHVAETHDRPDHIIIGEPSGTSGITLGYNGRLLHSVSLKREMDHSASASLTAGDLLVAYGAMIQSYAKEQNGERKKGFATLDEKIQKLSVTTDGFHEIGEMEVGFRLGPDFHPDTLEADIAKIFDAWKASLDEPTLLELESSFFYREVPAVYSKKEALPQVFRQAIRGIGEEPRHVFKTGTSDMNVLADTWDSPMIAYGPGDSALDHTPHEHISLPEYERAIQVLTAALLKLSEKLS